MPFLEDDMLPIDKSIDLSNRIDAPKGFAVTPGANDLQDDGTKPAWNWGAAFRRNNELAAAVSSQSLWTGNEPEAGFNPWDKIKGTPDEVNFAQLSEARNSQKFSAIQADIARENADRKLLDSQPWWMGLATEGTAGILSPTTLLPGGSFVKGAKGGIAVVKAGVSVGVANAIGSAVQESALHGIEQTRTAGESAMAVGASFFLGGLLGAGGQAVLSKGQWQKGVADLEHDLAGVRVPADAKPVFDDVYSQLKATGMADEEARVNASVFAARYATRAERLGEGATPFDAYKADGLEIRAGENGSAEGVGVFNGSPSKTLDERLDALADERHTLSTESFEGRANAKVPEQDVPLHDALSVASLPGSNHERSMNAAKWAMENGREDIAQAIVDRAQKRASAPVDLPGVAKDSPKYGEIAENLKAIREQDIRDAAEIQEAVGLKPTKEGGIQATQPVRATNSAAEPHGKITVYKDNSAVIDLFKGADKSTFMHEAGHLWLGEMVRDAAKSSAIKADLEATLKWLGVDDASKITLKEHEQWARGFEEYLRDGRAPSARLVNAFNSFKEWLTTIYKSLTSLGPDHIKITDDVRGVMDRMLATDSEIAARDLGPAGLKSMGAAANTATDLADNTIAGAMARGVAASTAKLNPLLRALHSPSAAYREIMLNTVENPIYLKKNFDGVASQPAVETLMKEYNGGLAKALKATNAGYPEYRKAGGQLGKDEFREAVGKAMRRGDADPDPIIAKIAQEYRASVFDPLKKQAIEAGLLPKDVSVDTAQSYFSRMWNGRKISADEQGFKGMVQDYVAQNAPKWAEQFDRSAERRLDPLHREISALGMEKVRRAEELKQRSADGEIEAGGPGEMTEADIRQALRIVNGKALPPKGVKTLSQFVVENGGLVDDAGELAHRGITNKARPGMIRTERRTAMSDRGGWTLDDMARHAWENDYFPDNHQRPSIDEFVEALNDDFSKTRAVLKKGDEGAYKLTELVNQLEADLSRAGVKADGKAPRFSTSDEMKGAVERVYKTLDAEAEHKIEVLKDKLSERQADIRLDRESRFVGDPKELGRNIADEVFDTMTGRTGTIRPEFITIKSRGPLKERTFNIEDLFRSSNGKGVEDYLESDVEQVARRYTRVMGADVELARKFGSVDMADQITKIRDDYRNMRAGVTDEKQLLALEKREKSDISDLEAVRDMLRGTNPGAPTDANYSRIIRAVNHFNYLRSMGEVAIASLTETVRPAMVHGLMPYMETLGQTLTNLKGIKASVAEAQIAGTVTERVLGTRLATLSEIIDPYASRGPVEAFLENMTNVASRWNGIRLLTDMQKAISAVMTQNRLLGGVSRFSEAAPKERAYLAYLGIDQSMAERIAKQFAEYGETIDKVHVANQEKWTDEVAARTYRAAISKDVDSIITTKGVADTPLFANTPTGRAMLQFKSFALASHQRVLLRGLQEDQSRFVGGLVAMTTIGMMATWLKAISGNRVEKLQDISKNPGWWIAEGFDKAGIFAVPIELANTFEKATGFNPIKTPMKAFDEGAAISQKNQNRSLIGSVVGPTAGLIDDATQVMGLPKKMIGGEDVTAGQKNAIERLLPFSSYPGIRQMIRYTVNPQTN